MLTYLTFPAIEPVLLSSLKQHLRMSGEEEDDLLNHYIKSARDLIEHYTGSIMIERDMEYITDHFDKDGYLYLPVTPVKTILTLDILDADENFITVDPLLYRLVSNVIIPETVLTMSAFDKGGIRVQFTAGYGSVVDNIPLLIEPFRYKVNL